MMLHAVTTDLFSHVCIKNVFDLSRVRKKPKNLQNYVYSTIFHLKVFLAHLLKSVIHSHSQAPSI